VVTEMPPGGVWFVKACRKTVARYYFQRFGKDKKRLVLGKQCVEGFAKFVTFMSNK
jgi:hypothetical protein